MPEHIHDDVRDRLDRMLGHWEADRLEDCEVLQRCGGATHRLRITAAGVMALDHEPVDAVAAALTGDRPACLVAVEEPSGALGRRRDLAEWLVERPLTVEVCDAVLLGVRRRHVRRFLRAGWTVAEAVHWRSWRLTDAEPWRTAGVPADLARALRAREEGPVDALRLLEQGWPASTAVLWANSVPASLPSWSWAAWRELPAGPSMCLEYAVRRLDPAVLQQALLAGSSAVEALRLAHAGPRRWQDQPAVAVSR